MSLCTKLLTVKSVSYSPMVLLGAGSTGFQSQMFWGLVFLVQVESVLKSRDITLSTNVCLVKAMVFPVVMYRCESWTIKKLSTEELMLLNCGVEEDS